MAKKSKYKIGEACRELDIQPYVLRYWETEFSQLSEGASGTGQRVYTADEIAIIRRIKELLYEEGYTIAGAKKKLDAELEEGLATTEEEVPVEEQAAGGEADGGADDEGEDPSGDEGEAVAAAAAVEPPLDEGNGAEASEAEEALARRLEAIRSDLEILRDEARSVAKDLRGG